VTTAQAGPTPQPRRARTGRGRAADRPDGIYEPSELVHETPTGFEVTVIGEDDRRRTFKFKTLPLPGWHQQLAQAFARCTGPQGKLRTTASASTTFWSFRRLLTTLEGMADPPATPADLTVRHLERYWFQRRAEIKQRGLHHEVWAVRSVLEQMTPGVIAEDVDAWLHRRLPAGELPAVPGYSDREFEAIMAAARSEVAAIRARLKQGQLLLARYEQEPDSLSRKDRQLAEALADIATTGVVPEMGQLWQSWDDHPMMQLARRLFVTDFDLGPLVTLAVGLSGRNSETIKNLTVEHEVLEDKAVRVELVKRRRGPSRMFETVHWEIGTPSQQLQRPGGYYLLLEQMMGLGRSFSQTSSLWSVWNPRKGHYGAFDVAMHLTSRCI
jgi:hypothetical protein